MNPVKPWCLFSSRRARCGSLPIILWIVPAISVALAGCGEPAAERPALGLVQGIVTLDGKPLEKAAVFFVPTAGEGDSSNAVTDAAGRYELSYGGKESGAVLGTHQVEIRTGGEGYDDEGNFFERPEKLPAIYHARSRLTAEVAAGENEINFDLKSR